MIASIIRLSIQRPGIVISLATVLLIYGLFQLSQAGLDIFPEFSPKQVVIQTEAPGLSSEQVETRVTQAVEQSIAGLMGLKQVRSESIQGLSIVTALFDESSDLYRNRQMITERLSRLATRLPAGVEPPLAVPLSSSSATVLTIGMKSDQHSLMELRSQVDWMLVPRLLSTPGVADVNVFGGEIQQLQIQIQPDRLRQYDLDIETVLTAARHATTVQGTGFIENSNQRLTLQVTGSPTTAEQLKQIIIPGQADIHLTLGDVAKVVWAPEPPIGAAQIMGDDGIVMMVIGQFGANTLSVSRNVEQLLQQLEPRFAEQGIQFYSHLFRPADYIETSVRNLSEHLLIGALFVVLVLYLFLFNIKTAFISVLAIPVSLLSAIVVLLQMGINLNIMVLGGLAIALGEVVDDAIIDSENIIRRLRQNRQSAQPQSAAEVVYNASLEVRGSVVYASFIVALVFVPLLMMGGVAGRLFSPLGFSYILAILMSLGVALTLTPALCYTLLRQGSVNDAEPPLIRALRPAYAAALKIGSKSPRLIMLLTLLSCLAGLFTVPLFNGTFLPELREGHYIVHTTSIPGTSLQESIRTGKHLVRSFLQIPGVESASQWAGRAERGADTYGSHYSEYEVRLKPMSGAEQQAVLNQLRKLLTEFPGLLFEANTFLTERVDETVSGYTAPVVVNLYGHDLDQLDTQAQAVAQLMRSISGATDVTVRSPPGTPMLQVQLQLDQLARWGLQPKTVSSAVQVAYGGKSVGKLYQDNRAFDIAVVLTPELRVRPDSLHALPLRTSQGTQVTLGQVANIRQTGSRYNILRQNGQRLQTITCQVDGRDLSTFMNELKQAMSEQVSLGENIIPEYTGTAVEQHQAKQTLLLYSLLSGAGVLMLIYIALGNFRCTLLTLLNLPFALLGGVLAVVITGATLSIGSIVGFITLFGITVRNSIMLVSHYQYLVTVEKQVWNLDTVIRGAQERMPSILMTALVTALAMLPIAIGSDNPGREIMGPMATIIIGGLASSTILNLLLLPPVLLRYGKFEHLCHSDSVAVH